MTMDPAGWKMLPRKRIHAMTWKATLPPEMVLHFESVNKLSTLGSTLSKDGIFFRGYSCTEELRKTNQKGS
jgi:hypothetical protein